MDVSVVIPTRNRSGQLRDLLNSLRAQQAKGIAWEVLVIDNASTDDTPGVVDSVTAGYSVPLRYIYEPCLGLHNGRNRGVQEAQGKVVAFLDDDMVVDNNWISGSKLVLEGGAALVGGRILPAWESSPPGWLKNFFSKRRDGLVLAYLGLIDLGDRVKAIDAHYVFGGNCFALKDVILRLRGYHPDSLPRELIKYRGDGETGFAIKFIERNLASLYSPAPLVHHRIGAERLTVDYFYRRRYDQGISDSFTQIRREHSLYAKLDSRGRGRDIPGRLAGMTRTAANEARRLLFPGVMEAGRIRQKGAKSYQEGFAFHQQEVRKDPKLLEWVLREDYLGENGRLPV